MTLLLALALAADPPPGEARTFTAPDGGRLPYRLLAPPPAPGARVPLLLFLHGAGERGDDNQKQLKLAGPLLAAGHRAAYPSVFVAPQCPADVKWTGTNWQGPDPKRTPELNPPLRRVLALLDAVAAEFPVDPGRVYVVGVSMGGSAAWDLVSRRPERFAAAVPVCGGVDADGVGPAAKVPLWAFQGAKDELVRPELPRRAIAALKAAGGAPRYTELPDAGHDAWKPAFAEPGLFDWLYAQKRG